MKQIAVTLPLHAAERLIVSAATDLIRARIAMDCPEYCWNAPWPLKGKAAWLDGTKQGENERHAIATLRAFGIDEFPFPNASDVFKMHAPEKARKIKAALIWDSERRAKAANEIATQMLDAWKAAQS